MNGEKVTFRIGETIQSKSVKSTPFVFVGELPTKPTRMTLFEFDSIFLANDNVARIYFSFDAGRTYIYLEKTEAITWDKCTNSLELWAYAAAASTNVRILLWNEG
jgi:hypothetical protein